MEATSLTARSSSSSSSSLLNLKALSVIHRRRQSPFLHFLKLKPSSSSLDSFSCQSKFKPLRHCFTVRSSKLPPVNSNVEMDSKRQSEEVGGVMAESQTEFNIEEVGSPIVPPNVKPPEFSLIDISSFLLFFFSCTACASFVGFVAVAVPTLAAMRRAALAFSKLADTAREEIPSTMTAIRLSGMEISDLTLELNDLSQEIADGVSKSTQAVQAADAGIRQIGSLAREQTMSMIEERANLPPISLQPVVAGAARKTSHVVGKATRTFLNIISGY